jgi:hypothetical protein
MNNEYVIINKTEVLKEIESLKESLDVSEKMGDSIRAGIETFEIKRLEWCLSRSTPLIPEIEKAYDAGKLHNELSIIFDNPQGRYISNLKLDI